MIRLLAGIYFLASGTAFAQAPPSSTDYFPLRPNAKWVYRVSNQELLVECVRVKRFGDQEASELVISTDGKQTAKDLYVIEKHAVYRVRSMMDDFVPPIKILSMPARKGDSWKINSREGDNVIRGEFSIIDDAAVIRTPAGDFRNCILVEGEVDLAGTRTTVRTWFAPNVGIVKLSYAMQGTESILDLVSFTSGEAAGLPPRNRAVPLPQLQPCPAPTSCRFTPPPPCRKTMRRPCRFILFRGRR